MTVLLPFDISRIPPRGLFGYMDEEDKPRGLLGMLDADTGPAPAGSGLVEDERGDGMVERNRAQDLLMQALIARTANMGTLFEGVRRGGTDLLGRILTNPMGIRPPTYDPVTGTPFVGRYMQNLGERFSETAQGLPLPGGMRPPPGPTASAPVTSLRRPIPAWPAAASDSPDASDSNYAVKHTGDDDFGPVWETDSWPEAVELLQREQRGEVRGQIRHEDIGGIAVPWGAKGSARSDGFGLSKLLEYHPDVVADLPEIVGNMRIVNYTSNRFRLENDSHYAVISRNFRDRVREPWILSAYAKK